jgi:predicted double-glycine peptidase
MRRIKFRKIFSVAIVISIALSMPAFAATSHPVPVDGTDYDDITSVPSTRGMTGVIGAREATAEDMAESANQVDKDLLIASHDSMTQTFAAASWMPLDPFTYYAQEKSYSCGPASVKMALKFLTGTTYSESTIRTGCSTTTGGTYLSDMKVYINDEQSENPYVTMYQETKDNMKDDLYAGIVTWDAPPIVGLKETTNDGWGYNLAAHFVVIYSIMSDKSEVALCDPWAGYNSSSASDKWVDKSTDDLFTAYDAVNVGYMY